MLSVGLDGSRPIRRIVWMIIGMINAHPTKSDAKASGSCSTTESISGVRLRCVSLAVGLLGCSPRRPGPTSGQGLTGGDLAGHLGQLPSRGPGSPAQMGEGLLVIQAFAFHQGALGPLDHAPRVQRGLELVGKGAGELGLGRAPGREQGPHQCAIGLQGADLTRVPAPGIDGIHIQGPDLLVEFPAAPEMGSTGRANRPLSPSWGDVGSPGDVVSWEGAGVSRRELRRGKRTWRPTRRAFVVWRCMMSNASSPCSASASTTTRRPDWNPRPTPWSGWPP